MSIKSQAIITQDNKTRPMMNINTWKGIINFTSIDKYPLLPCPYCSQQQLALDTTSIQKRPIPEKLLAASSKKFKSIKAMKEVKADENFQRFREKDNLFFSILAGIGNVYQEMIDPLNGEHYQFCGFFNCNACQQSVTCSGVYLQANKVTEKSVTQKPVIKVDHFSPTIPMIPVSIHVPEQINLELVDAFKHFHFDPLSSASKLRRAIEQFCIDFKVKGRNLHQKICSLKDRYPEEAEYLEALKLIGNEGTHDHDVSEIDLLHAFEIMQFVLDIYDRKARYKATQTNYEQLVSKYGKDKMTLTLSTPVNHAEVEIVK